MLLLRFQETAPASARLVVTILHGRAGAAFDCVGAQRCVGDGVQLLKQHHVARIEQ